LKLNRWSTYKYNRRIGMSIPNAAIAAGYPRSLVDKHTKNLPIPITPTASGGGFSTDFFALFEQKQMTDLKKVEHAVAGMDAMKVVSLETDETTKNGKKVYIRQEVPDWTARHKYYETMLKLCKQMEKGSSNNKILVLGAEFANKLKVARERSTEEVKQRLEKDIVVEAHIATTDVKVEVTEDHKKGMSLEECMDAEYAE